MKISYLLVCLFTVSLCLNATPIAVNNAGFEANVLNNGSSIQSISGWSFSGVAGSFNPTSAHYPGDVIPEGNNVAFSNAPTISQILSTALTANTTYTLLVDIGRRLDNPAINYSVQLLAGGTLLAEENSLSFNAGQFKTSNVTHVTSANPTQLGQQLEIRLVKFAGGQVNFDNVRLDASTTTVPEPGSFFLLALGFFMAGSLRSSRTKFSS